MKKKIEKARMDKQNQKDTAAQIEDFYKEFKGWADEYESAALERRRVILSQLFSRIEIGRGYEVKSGNRHELQTIFESLSVPFPVSWTVKMKKKQKETQDILSYHSQAAGCSDKARAKASGGRQPIEECGRTGL